MIKEHKNMSKKTGRNDPCPCGSGKKYKKCCGLSLSHGGFVQTPESWFPPSARTGTLWDDYMELIPIVAMYGKKIMDFGEDGKEFRRAVSDFEKQFRPGKKGGITDSFYMSWKHLDLRFGESLETVVERLVSDPMISQLNEPGPTYIRQLSESYATFYEVITSTLRPDIVTVEELGTGKSYTVFHVRELCDIDLGPGDICFTRRIGSPDRSIFFTTPYIFEPEAREQFKRAVLAQEKDFKMGPRAPFFPPGRHFAESQKEAAPFWAWHSLQGEKIEIPQIPDSVLVTTDGDAFVFTEIHFLIQDEAALRKRLSVLPLGSGALAGHSLGIDQELLAHELGFERVAENSLDAVGDRDFILEFLGAASILAIHLSRLAEDLILWSTAEFGFLELDEAFSTGSSLMPQKKNPDSLELIRAKAGRIVGNLVTLLTVTKGLPSSYNRDLQEDKEPLFDTLETIAGMLDIMKGVISTVSFRTERMEAALDDYILTTDLAEYLVRKGVPFRDSHAIVGGLVRRSLDLGIPLRELPLKEFRQASGFFAADVYEVFDFRAAVERRASYGGTATAAVRRQLAKARAKLKDANHG